MKVEISPRLYPRRGGEVKEGNVYSAPRFFRVVMAVIDAKKRVRGRGWNNVVCIHVDAEGDIVGASCQPIQYVQNHQDLIGRVKKMPSLKIEWLQEHERTK